MQSGLAEPPPLWAETRGSCLPSLLQLSRGRGGLRTACVRTSFSRPTRWSQENARAVYCPVLSTIQRKQLGGLSASPVRTQADSATDWGAAGSERTGVYADFDSHGNRKEFPRSEKFPLIHDPGQQWRNLTIRAKFCASCLFELKCEWCWTGPSPWGKGTRIKAFPFFPVLKNWMSLK